MRWKCWSPPLPLASGFCRRREINDWSSTLSSDTWSSGEIRSWKCINEPASDSRNAAFRTDILWITHLVFRWLKITDDPIVTKSKREIVLESLGKYLMKIWMCDCDYDGFLFEVDICFAYAWLVSCRDIRVRLFEWLYKIELIFGFRICAYCKFE